MSVGIKVGPVIGEVGESALLEAFFSTVAGVLEHGTPGSRFPAVSGDFYDGQVAADRTGPALAELHTIRDELARHPASALIRDLDGRSAHPAEDGAPSAAATLDCCFVTSTGRNLLDLLLEAFSQAFARQLPVGIVTVPER